MKAFLLLAIAATACQALETNYHLSEEEFEAIYGGHTDDEDLEHRKAEALAANEAQINAQNLAFEAGEAEFFEGLNADSDKPADVFKSQKTGALTLTASRFGLGLINRALDDPERVDAYSEAHIKAALDERQTYPASFDSRQYGWISPVKNQLQCGSCVSFSTVATVETCMFKNNGGKQHVDLAEETLVDCGYNGGSMNGCGGAQPDQYLTLMGRLNGELPHEYSDPYRNTNPYLSCRNVAPIHWGAKVSNRVFTFSCNDTVMKDMIYRYGAAVTTIYASSPSFQNYNGGIYSTNGGQADHAVAAVGWQTDSYGRTVWIVKNSWGSGWGESGFFRILSGTSDFGKFCGSPQCTQTNQFSTVPSLPSAKSCDVSKIYGPITSPAGGWYNLNVNGQQSTCTCSNGICTPTTPQNNACVYICGSISC